ncbi:MAG: hypothetical protein GX307_03675 [Euryarchaeota archaeon]|nr:hypothetical protein [Euryarchaeota archaeon]
MRPSRLGRLKATVVRPATLVLVLGLLMTMAVPMYLLNEPAPYQGVISDGLGDNVDLATPSGDGGTSPPTDAHEDFELGVGSDRLEVDVTSTSCEIRTDEYSILVTQDGDFVDYTIHPYFTDDVIRYRRVNPNVAAEGTVDENGNDLNWVSMKISDHGQDGNKVWFMESCPQFSMRQEFTIFRDYFELDTTYIPGESNAVVSYFVGLYDENNGMIDLFSDGKVHRYVPGFDEKRPSTHGIGGWYPSFEMFAPSFDLRTPNGDLGLEWGYNEEEAYLWAPIWMKDFGGGGPSTFCLKFSSKSSVLPDPARGEETAYHMFVRPYKHTDGNPIGHNYGYAKWVAHKIAEEWTVHNTPIFPLTLNNIATWDDDLRNWVEASQITVASQSNNPDQINWHYKSAQLMIPHDGTMPTEWQLHDAPGQQMYSPSGYRIASAASAAYRDHLINGDPYNDWWWSSDGVFWDEINVVNGYNQIRNDYNYKDEFVYTGFLRLVEETYDSGKFDYTVTNPFTALLHLAMVSDLSLIEGYEAVPMYNNDLKAHTASVMNFVNNMPSELRPRISVDQNYDAYTDQQAVYSVLFGAAKYGFYPNLRCYDPGSAQLHNLQMAEAMFLAMGADRHSDPEFWPATLDLGNDGNSIVTGRPMVVLTGEGTPTIEFIGQAERYSLTNLWSSERSFTVVLPTPGLYEVDGLVQNGEVKYTADGKAILTGTIAAEGTGHIIKRSDVAASHSGDGEAFIKAESVGAASLEVLVRATGGETALTLSGLSPNRNYEVLSDGTRVALVRTDDSGQATFVRAYGATEERITVAEAGEAILPEIIGAIPSNGSEGAPINTNITITFNKPVDRASFEAAFSVSGAEDVEGAFTWSESGDRVIFTPIRPLSYDAEYVIEASEVVDLDGSVSTGLYRSTFRTGSSATGFELTGQVRDGAGIPIEGAAVTLEGRGNSTTDDVGRFSFTGLNVGNHTLEVRYDGFAATAIPVEIADQDAFVDLTMERLPQPLTSATVRHAIHDLEPPIALVISAALLFGLVTTGRADRGVDIIGQRLERLAQALQRLRRT